MGQRPLVVFVALLASLIPFRTAPQSLQISQSENFHLCLEGVSECNWNQLTPQERHAVKQSAEDGNFEDCFTGSRECDATKLTMQQKLEITGANHNHNLQNCLDGYGECKLNLQEQKTGCRCRIRPQAAKLPRRNRQMRPRSLTKEDRAEVARAAQDRNVRDCLNGSEDCDRTQLGDDERRDAPTAAHRNDKDRKQE